MAYKYMTIYVKPADLYLVEFLCSTLHLNKTDVIRKGLHLLAMTVSNTEQEPEPEKQSSDLSPA